MSPPSNGHGPGAVSHQQRGRYARTARSLQRGPAQGDRVLTRPGADERLAANTRPWHQHPQRRTAAGPQERHPQLCARWRRPDRRRPHALCRNPGEAGRTEPEVQRKHWMPPTRSATPVRKSWRVFQTMQQAALAAAQAEGKEGQAHAQNAVLPGCHAFADSSTLRETLYRVYVTRAPTRPPGQSEI